MRAVAMVLVLAWRTVGADPVEPPRDRAWRLTKMAEAAARSDDCTQVATIAGEVRALDLDFYTTVTARDAAVARCLETTPPVEPPPPPAPPPPRPVPPPATAPPEPTRPVCIEGERRPRCASILVGELAWRFGNIETLSFGVGLLVNGHGDNAYGATIGALGYKHPDDSSWTSSDFLELRYRRWLSADEGVDLGIAGVHTGDGSFGAMASASFEGRDLFAITASVEVVPIAGRPAVGASFGLRLGAEPIAYTAYFLAALVDTFAHH